MRSKFAALLLTILLAPHTSGAKVHAPAVKGRFGPEFTFAPNEGAGAAHDKKKEFVLQVRHHLKTSQPLGAKFVETAKGAFELFQSPNGWKFEVNTDPGVMEIKMDPLTVEEVRRYKDDIQSAIFVNAAIVGLFPWDYLGGGHLNFGIEIFGGSVLLARNFVVDFWNHNELSMGILNYDTYNAVPFELFDEIDQNEIRHVIALADAGEWPDTEDGVLGFFRALNAKQSAAKNHLTGANRGKNHALNLGHAGRVEIRAVRPQANMDIWLNQIELIESRINNHLRFIEKPLPFKPRIPLRVLNMGGKEQPESSNFVPPIDPQLALQSFHRYVTEARLAWSDHKTYIWPNWRQAELEKFEAGNYFKLNESQVRLRHKVRAAMDCKSSLTP